MARKLILAEKPAVARDLARVLKVPSAGAGSFESADFVITWCIGHLIELEEPASYGEQWKRWSLDSLPILPASFLLRPVKTTAGQWRVVRGLLRERGFAAVINACDAGREGELIFRLCYELAGSKLPIERLWISSLTDQAIAAGMARLRGGRELEPLAAAARCRAEADWLVGMNGTRAITLQRRAVQDVLCSIGRVQTPTLALLVRRERQIERHVPRDYFEVHADLQTKDEARRFRAQWRFRKVKRLAALPLAEEIRERSTAAAARGEGPVVESVEGKTQREPPPLLFDLTALQRTANRRFGLSAHRTLQVAQALYERHKLITYPRTDSRYLTSDLHPQLARIFAALGQDPGYAPLVAPLLLQPPPPLRRVFQDSKARDHHAIIPTPVALSQARLDALSREERDLFDLIARRFIGAFYPDAEFQQTVVVVRVGLPAEPEPPPPRTRTERPEAKAAGTEEAAEAAQAEAMLEQVPPPPDRYEARGRVRTVVGWQAVAGYGAPAEEGEEEQRLPLLVAGQPLGGRFQIEARQTQPPPRYSEATLLSAMEAAGQQISDPELRQEMKDLGLGTPATRASMIETLLQREYITRSGKVLTPTALGVDLIEKLPVAELASPELTGRWEARLAQIARGEETRAAFMADIARYVQTIIDLVRAAPPLTAVPGVGPAPGGRATRGAKAATGRGATRRTGAVTPRGKRARAASPIARAASAPRLSTGTETTTRPRRARTPRATTAETTGAAAEKPRRRSRATASTPGAAATAPRAASAPAGATAPWTSAATRPSHTPQDPAGARPSYTPREPAAERPPRPLEHTRSQLAAANVAVGTALEPALRCPRCQEGQLLIGRRGWGCSRWQERCPLVIPFEVLGHRLKDAELRALVQTGVTPALRFHPGGGDPVRGRLRLAAGGSPAGFVYLDHDEP